MFRNYFKIAARNLVRNKGYSFINIFGLAIGMACTILILLWVQHELSYDRFHENADRIYRINKQYQMGNEVDANSSTPYPLANTAKESFAEITEATKFTYRSALVKYQDKVFKENHVCFADSAFFRVFRFQAIEGDPNIALTDPNSLVITQNLAEKYFGTEPALGKTVTVDNLQDFTVSAIIQDIPENSELQHNLFIPVSFVVERESEGETDWGSHWFITYILLHQNANPSELEAKLSAMIKEKLETEQTSLRLQPLTGVHLYTPMGESVGLKYVYFFSIIAIVILGIACINYMNLATARSAKRAKEVGLRKVVGAKRTQIIYQFFGESLLFSVIALIVAVFLVELALPAFSNLTGKELHFNYMDYRFGLLAVVIVGITGIISGIYPAVFLSSLSPVTTLKGTLQRNLLGLLLRKGLVIIQFSLAIILMIGTGIIFSQLRYIQNKDLGFDKDHLMYLPLPRELRNSFDAAKAELLEIPDILGITRSMGFPNDVGAIIRGIVWEGKETDEGAAFAFETIDQDYIETVGLEIVQGRNFSHDFPDDTLNYILNEKAIGVMGMENPIGKPFNIDDEAEVNGVIVGVVKNFHSKPLNYEIEPLMFMMYPDYYRRILIRTNPKNIKNTIKHIESVWKKFVPDYPFEYRFLNEDFDSAYRAEQRAGTLFGYFVVLAILLSCLGLFGLTSFSTEQRTKEIGVRKVLGATVPAIVVMLSKEFTKWVLLANIIAWPIGYFIMKKWLENFAYRVDIGIEIFIGSAVLALAIATLTISYQSIKAAIANPIKALRYE